MGVKSPYFPGTGQEKPREKALRLGFQSLSDAELVGLLLDTGTPKENVIDLAARLLEEKGGLCGLFLKDGNIETYGVRKAKACRILAAKEIMRRLPFSQPSLRILNEDTAYELTKNFFLGRSQEWALVLYLGKRKELLQRDAYPGGDNTVFLPVGKVIQQALLCSARFLLVLHNHPSGNLYPSPKDLETTTSLAVSASTAGLVLLDSLIVSEKDKLSLRRNGMGPFAPAETSPSL